MGHLTLVEPSNAEQFIGRWLRVVTLGGVIHGRIVGVEGHTLLVEGCPLSKIDLDDITVWAENDA